eukprot:Skav219185  [mRNA]  locus=scaffold648:590196:590495:+ [translate_table: standard]
MAICFIGLVICSVGPAGHRWHSFAVESKGRGMRKTHTKAVVDLSTRGHANSFILEMGGEPQHFHGIVVQFNAFQAILGHETELLIWHLVHLVHLRLVLA